MELLTQWCRNCGGDLLRVDDHLYRCRHCTSEYTHEESQKYVDKMRSLFDETKLEAISNARRNLYDAVNAEYISSTRVHECCVILKQYLPDDFQANFYEIAIGSDGRQIARFIRKIDTAENADYMEGAIRFLIRSLQSEYVGQTQELIERTFKNTSLVKYETYSTELSDEAKKLDDCIYMTTYPRDVFVAYSSKDMDEVWELVECLEEQGLSCFVAARNLRHGKGSVENYEQALREAMDNCASFVLVSTPNSRHAGCDALKKEIPYIKQRDTETAPPEHRNDYAGLPHKYKKHRVEYRLRESARPVAADKMVAEFFDGYERVYSPGEVAERVLNAGMEYEKPIFEEISTTELLKKMEDPKAEQAGEGNVERKSSEAITACNQKELPRDPQAVHVMIPKGTTDIDRYAYWMATRLASVTMPEGVTKIWESAFGGCTGLASVTMPESVTHICAGAFSGCTGLTSITLPKYVENIAGAFSRCTGLTSITIPKHVENISGAFSQCTGLTSVTISEGVTRIGDAAFQGCTSLTSLTIPKSVTYIGDCAFEGCTGLTSVTIPKDVTYIGKNAFAECRVLTSVTIPKSVKHIGERAFWRCSNLEDIKFSNPFGWKNYISAYDYSYISAFTLLDSKKAAQILTKTFANRYLERIFTKHS